MSPSGHVVQGGFLPRGVGPAPGLGEVEVTPKEVFETLHEIVRSLEKQSAHMAVGDVGWLFLTVLKKKGYKHENARCKALWNR